MSVGDEFGRRAADDELCAAVAKAVADGDSDALRRLGLDGWGDYVQRLSELMNESVRDELDYSPDFGALMSQVASPARYAHHLVTESGTAVQKAKDTPLGIHIKPLEPEFDDDALKGTVGTAASMDDPERAVETLADGLAYAVKKAGNDFVQANAEQRSRAGFEVGVKRSGSTKCCPWCAARIGSWALKNAPDGVFGCHAKCSCVVEYTSSTGAVSQRRGTGRFVEVEYQPPHVMTHEEAKEKGGFDEPKRLTGGGNGGILNDDIINIGSKGLTMSNKQQGKKFGKHAYDFGLDPSDKNSRDKLQGIIADIHDNFESKVTGLWRGQGILKADGKNREDGKVIFFIKGNDVVVCSTNDEFITILKDGVINNERVKRALAEKSDD